MYLSKKRLILGISISVNLLILPREFLILFMNLTYQQNTNKAKQRKKLKEASNIH